jgi:hypothetical protein
VTFAPPLVTILKIFKYGTKPRGIRLGFALFEKDCEMNRTSRWITAVFICVLMLPVASEAQTGDTLYLVAAKESRIKAQPWIDFLKTYDLPVEHYVLSELDLVKNQDYIAIAGGLDEAGIQDLLVDVIGDSEVASLQRGGAKKMFLKENVWKQGQKVMVFAGNDAEAAAAARSEAKEEWMEYLEEWFDLEEIPGGLRAY